MSRTGRRWWLLLLVLPAAVAVGLFVLMLPHRPRPVATALGPVPSGTVNILVIGRDARALEPLRSDGTSRVPREPRSHSDVVIIAHVNLDLGRVSLVGVPRDLVVSVPGVTAETSPTDFEQMEKLTHVYAIGGDALLRRTLERLLGITLHRSVALDFDTFRMTLGLLRPFLAGLRVAGVPLTDRGAALQLARRRLGLPEDDMDRARNNLRLLDALVGRLWWVAGTRLGRMLQRRALAVIGPDTDLTPAELDQIIWGLKEMGFRPSELRTAVLVSEGAELFFTRYDRVLSCYLPAYDEIRRQADRFLHDRDEIAALDFMVRQPYAVPGYIARPRPTHDTAGTVDPAARSTRLLELERLGIEPDSGD